MVGMTGAQIAWWVALGVAALVAIVVWILLEILRRTVHQIRRGVDDVLSIGGRLAQNTWTVQLLQTTKQHGVALLEEVQKHERSKR
jgi:hypothetical protein